MTPRCSTQAVGILWPRVSAGPLSNLMPHKLPWWRLPRSGVGIRADKTVVRDLAAELEWAKVSMVTPDAMRTSQRQTYEPRPQT